MLSAHSHGQVQGGARRRAGNKKDGAFQSQGDSACQGARPHQLEALSMFGRFVIIQTPWAKADIKYAIHGTIFPIFVLNCGLLPRRQRRVAKTSLTI